MNSQRAREILLFFRPGTEDATEPSFAEALAQVQQDAELAAWFEAHCDAYAVVRDQLRKIPVPSDLKGRILAARRPADNIVQIWWRRPSFLSAAAAVLLLLGLAAYRFMPHPEPDDLAAFRNRMVRSVLREYRMDLETTSEPEIRSFLGSHEGFAEYQLPSGLEKVPRTGCGILNWRGQPVTMVCFGPARKPNLFLFVIDRATLPDAPAAGSLSMLEVKRMMTASWTTGGKVYVLAGTGTEEAVRKLF